MKSFVTGATGFVGCHVVRHLLAAGDAVRVLVRPASNLRALEGLPLEFAEGDLRDCGSLDAALQGIDRVFHVAADYRLWSARPEEMYESNVAGTRNVLQAAQGTQEVSGSIAGVSQAAQQTGSAAGQVLASAGELSRNGEALKAQVRSFLNEVRAA